MSNLIHYSSCPVCGSEKLSPALQAIDHTVSKQAFAILHCNHCTFRFTQDVPDVNSIGPYYQSEEYISHSDTGKGIINRLYHIVRKRTLSGKRRLVEGMTGVKRGIILDVGAGTGAFLNEMKTTGWQITGLEPDAGARAIADKLYSLSFNTPDKLFEMPQDNYEAITMWHVLEHVHDLNGYVSQLKKLLKPNGKLLIAVPNYTSYDAVVYKEFWAAYDVPRHLYHFSPASLKALMEKHGMKIIAQKPMWYDSFYVSLLSSKYKNARLNDAVGQGKSNFIGAGWVGFISNFKALFDVKRCSSVIYIISK
jgi:2-polyprenyl-3-methyl-5-hydroxy-6-metoxy-1,4-benzoquinol methylase